jgi:hypothetical protein
MPMTSDGLTRRRGSKMPEVWLVLTVAVAALSHADDDQTEHSEHRYQEACPIGRIGQRRERPRQGSGRKSQLD